MYIGGCTLNYVAEVYKPLLPSQTVNKIDLDVWLPYFLSELDAAHSTKETYARVIRIFSRYLKENGITLPHKMDVIQYKEHLKESGKSANTIQNYIIGVKQIFKWAVENEYYHEDITRGVKGVKLPKEHQRDALTREQVRAVATTFDRTTLKGKRDYALYVLMVTTGARTIELVRANIGDLGAYYGEGALFVQGKGMLDKSRPLKIAFTTEQALKDYLNARGHVTDSEPLFASLSNQNKGGRITTRAIRGIIQEALEKSIVKTKRTSAHSLRHTFATENLLAGGTLQETQNVLGHASISTTMKYTHNHTRRTNDSENRVADALFNQNGGYNHE